MSAGPHVHGSPEDDARAAASRHNVLFFDGECGLCNALVRFLLRRDRRGLLHFAPLQGRTAQAFLRHHGMDTENFSSLVLVDDIGDEHSAYWLRTNGVLKLFSRLGGGWKILTVFRVVPAPLRDLLYRFVARVRHRVFGEYRPRPLENPEWVQRFLE